MQAKRQYRAVTDAAEAVAVQLRRRVHQHRHPYVAAIPAQMATLLLIQPGLAYRQGADRNMSFPSIGYSLRQLAARNAAKQGGDGKTWRHSKP